MAKKKNTAVDSRSRIVRDSCILARQDLTADPTVSKLELIVCRDVLGSRRAPTSVLRIRPDKDQENRIDGAVLAFADGPRPAEA